MEKPEDSKKKAAEDADEASKDKYSFLTSDSAAKKSSNPFSAMNFVIIMSLFFLAFYCIAVYWSFKAYREFKGVVEEGLGSPEAMRKYNQQQSLGGYGLLNQDPDTDS